MSRILVIEDDAQIRENLVWLFEAEGFEVESAAGGREGIERAARMHPDVVLCDVVMPDVDGYEVLRRLRAEPETALVPFVFLTARAEREDVRAAMASGADDYVTKPFSADEVLAAVRARLQRQALVEQQQEARLDRLRVSISRALPHELRTPLVAILGFSELLLAEYGETDRESALEMLQAIFDAGRRLERTVENYSSYAHLELVASDAAARAEMRQAQTPDAALLVEAAARREAARYDRSADLVLAVADGSVAVRDYLLKKVVEELVSNAFKFSEPGTPVAVTGTYRGDRFVLEVVDRGRGMAPEQYRRTGAFVQFDRQEFEQQGSGLGLAIARRVALLHGGSFDLASAPGAGTRTTLLLPGRPNAAAEQGDGRAGWPAPAQ